MILLKTFQKVVLFLLLHTVCFTAAGQNDTISQKNGQITYKEKFINLDGNTDNFKTLLIFNETESLRISHKRGMENAEGSKMVSNENGVSMAPDIYDEKGQQLYRNLLTKEVIIRIKEYKPFPSYIVKDNWVDITWEIKDEYKTIANHKVQKAEGYFRGRNWTVWFAPDIPQPFGPNKLHGLPGVILEAKDKDYHIVATAVCYPCDSLKTATIEKPEEATVRTIEEEVLIQDNWGVFSILERHKQGKYGLTLHEAPTEASIWASRKRRAEVLYEWEDKKTKRVLQDKDKINATLGKNKTPQIQQQVRN